MPTFDEILAKLNKDIMNSYITKYMMEHKRQTALRLVREGFSVEWCPNGSEQMVVYIPQRGASPERKATIIFKPTPLQEDIHHGQVLRAEIEDQMSGDFSLLGTCLEAELYNCGEKETGSTIASYKANIASAVVRQGYSVGWFPDTLNQMEIYEMICGGSLLKAHAFITFSDAPSDLGLNKGRITRLEMRAKMAGYPSSSDSNVYLFEGGVVKNNSYEDELMIEIYPSFKDLHELILAEFN